jgi:hypothetical protein
MSLGEISGFRQDFGGGYGDHEMETATAGAGSSAHRREWHDD